MTCEVGDIVLVSNYRYPDGSDGSLHSFVVIDIRNDALYLMPLEYLCFLISSKNTKENYLYNIPIKKDNINRLIIDSHVKCDFIYEGIRKDDILMIVGSVTPEQLDSFWDAYEAFLDATESTNNQVK